MSSYSTLNAPPIRSRISNGLIFVVPFLGLFVVVGIYLLYAGWEVPDPTPRLGGSSFIALPLYMYILIVQGYYTIMIERGWVNLRGLIQSGEFPLSDIQGHAFLYRRHRGAVTETLHLALPDETIVKIESSLYRNYDEIREALTQGSTLDLALLAKVTKQRKWTEFIWVCRALGIAILLCFYLWLESQKPSLTAAELQAVMVSLTDKPLLKTEISSSGRSRSTRTFIHLYTHQFPGLPFKLEGAALDGADVAAMTQLLEAGDTLRMLVLKPDHKYLIESKRSSAQISTSSIDVYAVSGSAGNFLSLAAYNRQHKIKLILLVLGFAVNIGLVVLIAGWKYWQYTRINIKPLTNNLLP